MDTPGSSTDLLESIPWGWWSAVLLVTSVHSIGLLTAGRMPLSPTCVHRWSPAPHTQRRVFVDPCVSDSFLRHSFPPCAGGLPAALAHPDLLSHPNLCSSVDLAKGPREALNCGCCACRGHRAPEGTSSSSPRSLRSRPKPCAHFLRSALTSGFGGTKDRQLGCHFYPLLHLYEHLYIGLLVLLSASVCAQG